MHIQEFSVANFKSFKDINTLSLMATKSVSGYKDVDENNLYEIPGVDLKLMKTKAIYGANSSGKSNIIKALNVFIDVIKNSVIDKNILSKVDCFRFSTVSEISPSFFQIVFWENNVKYRYGFEATNEEITSEWLYHKPGKREESLFIRDGQKLTEINKKNFIEGSILLKFIDVEKGNNEFFRSNALLLTTLSTFGFAKVCSNVIKAISSINVISGLGDFDLKRNAEERLQDENLKEYILNILKFGDIGIKDLNIFKFGEDDLEDKNSNSSKKKKKENVFVFSVRPKFDEFNIEDGSGLIFFSQESEGTQKLFELAPYIYESFKNETPLIIDEFDARFHPLLTREIIKLFNSINSRSPQLVFTTHDTNLLDSKIFRKDQIDFVEKDSFSSSHLYSLIEFKGERNSKNFESDYIKGKYGAIPYLGDFSKLFDLIDNAEKN
ncbi:ATP-binding protein [Chryseobacterium indoltheticum]|uniref:AAA family ATPase n=1 Tax=Chryseobacterium indoltheticum TaxID=254 RepID=UPI0028EC197B|nr:ATP-binding protein [Chryseobacterium indoltheticum]